MNLNHIVWGIIGVTLALSLLGNTDKPSAKTSKTNDHYTKLITNCVRKALSATEDYYRPIKYDDYDKAKAWAREYKVLTEKFSEIVDDCPKDRYNEKNMLKAALNVVANRNSSLWAYTMYVEARTFRDRNAVQREQERATKYINDAEKYRKIFRSTYGF